LLATGYSAYRGYLPAIASRSGEAGGESRSHRNYSWWAQPSSTGSSLEVEGKRKIIANCGMRISNLQIGHWILTTDSYSLYLIFSPAVYDRVKACQANDYQKTD